MLFSGSVSRALTHRYTIVLSSVSNGVMLFAVAMSFSLIGMQICMLLLGMGSSLYFASGMRTLYDLVDPNFGGVSQRIIPDYVPTFIMWRLYVKSV